MRQLVSVSVCLALAMPTFGSAGSVRSHDPLPPVPNRSLFATPQVPGDAAALCETAAIAAESASRLPPRLLQAISLTESGRIDPASDRLRPWPWTINAEGSGQFFGTKQQAVAAVKMLQAQGVQSIDVGCLQVNLMYHPAAFASLEQAFDPRTNAAYAARFLNALYAEGRDWAHAIAAYHSETPALGDAYRALVMSHWDYSGPPPVAPVVAAYSDFVSRDQVYAAFAPRSQVYGAFARSVTGR